MDGWMQLQKIPFMDVAIDYEKIPFKCKHFHEYGHFTKSCLKKPEKPIPDDSPSEGWNVASGKRTAKPSKQQNPTSKNSSGNRFEVLDIETPEEGNKEKTPEMENQEADPPVNAPHQDKEDQGEGPGDTQSQEKEVLGKGSESPKERHEQAANSEGSNTRAGAKASAEEITDTYTEEQEPQSRKGRKSNRIIIEQEAAREKAAGKQANLDFLVKNSQANKYLLTAEEEKKEKDRALKQSRK